MFLWIRLFENSHGGYSTVNKATKTGQPGTKWFKAENGTKRSVNLRRSFV